MIERIKLFFFFTKVTVFLIPLFLRYGSNIRSFREFFELLEDQHYWRWKIVGDLIKPKPSVIEKWFKITKEQARSNPPSEFYEYTFYPNLKNRVEDMFFERKTSNRKY